MKQQLENSTARVYLKKGKLKPLKNRHRWIFSGAVERIEGDFTPGDVVSVYSSDGRFQAKAFINPHSQIMLRVISFCEEPITTELIQRRLQQAAAFRENWFAGRTNAYRLVSSEADGLPGLVVDRYDRVLVFQFFSLGMARWREWLIDLLSELFSPLALVEKSSGLSLQQEGLSERIELVRGTLPESLIIEEYGTRSLVDVLGGQKTGLFLDQRENRRRVNRLMQGGSLLNCFSYTGGFSLAGALAGAVTTSVEINNRAQQMARANFQLNGLDPNRHRFVTANVFEFLRRDQHQYDVVVLDPPAFVKKQKHLQRGLRGYKDINRLGLMRVKNGGLMLTCSCSHFVNWDLFQKVVFAAAVETGREVQLIGRFSQPPDHPVSLFHPEGEYLKTFLLRVND